MQAGPDNIVYPSLERVAGVDHHFTISPRANWDHGHERARLAPVLELEASDLVPKTERDIPKSVCDQVRLTRPSRNFSIEIDG